MLLLSLAGLFGCASSSTISRAQGSTGEALPSQPVPRASRPLNACRQWELPLHAHLSHISASQSGKHILISTSADAKHEGRMRFLNGAGKVLWMHDLNQPVRQQALTPSGDLLAINTYDGKLSIYNSKGKKLWEKEHLGRPVIFPRSRRVILLNDDDSEPKMAFTTYDFTGKLIATVTASTEPIEMDTPDDESYVAITTTDRMLLVYEPEGRLAWQTHLAGDSISIETVGAPNPRIYALTSQPKNKDVRTLSAYEPKAGSNELVLKWSVPLDRKYENVHVSGALLFLYGNNHHGQALAAHRASDGGEVWRRSYPAPASYSSLVYSGSGKQPFMTAALDEGVPAGVLHVMAIDGSGTARWDAAINASSGLYSYAFAEEGAALVAGAGEPGDGLVEYIKVTPEKCRKR